VCNIYKSIMLVLYSTRDLVSVNNNSSKIIDTRLHKGENVLTVWVR
jgi:hypothetical protein